MIVHAFYAAIHFFVISQLTSLSDAFVVDSSSLVADDPSVAAVVGVAAAVACVLLLLGCASLCPRKTEFKDFDNEDAFPDVQFPSPPAPAEFSMVPPTEDTPARGASISFEPLPDLATRIKLRRLQPSNSAQCRPKILHVGRGRGDSDEGVVGGGTGDPTLEKARLERVLVASATQCSRGQLQYIKELGTGWFGKVLHAESLSVVPEQKRSQVVIQMLKVDANHLDQYNYLLESAPYRDVDHANVLKIIGYCVETTPYLTVLELCANGDLKSYLRNHRGNVELIEKHGLLLNFACDLAAGLQALHQANYVHRDFALRNCLVTQDLAVKVGDYGLFEQIYKEDYYRDVNGDCLPIRWLAPEVIDISESTITLRQITKDSNLWSFGVSLWELVSIGAMPYAELTDEQVLRQVVLEHSAKLFRPELPVSNLDRLYQLMALCWSAPSQRPSLRELRIMLLHLRSHSDEPDDSDDFERKWHQLMPRRAAALADPGVATIDVEDITFYSNDDLSAAAAQRQSNGAAKNQGVVLRHQVQLEMKPARPTSFESDFSELNASMLAHTGSLQHSLASSSMAATPEGMTFGSKVVYSFPTDEMNLETELSSALNGTRQTVRHDESVSEEGSVGGEKGVLNERFELDGSLEEANFNVEFDADKYPGTASVGLQPVDRTNGVGERGGANQKDDALVLGHGSGQPLEQVVKIAEVISASNASRIDKQNGNGDIDMGHQDENGSKAKTLTLDISDDSEASENQAKKKRSPNSDQDDWSIIHPNEFADAAMSLSPDGTDNMSGSSFTHVSHELFSEDGASKVLSGDETENDVNRKSNEVISDARAVDAVHSTD